MPRIFDYSLIRLLSGLQEEEGEGEEIYISKLSPQQYLITAYIAHK